MTANKATTPLALLNADALARRMQETPSLASSQRVAMVVLLSAVLWAVDRSQPWVWAFLLLFGLGAALNLWRVLTGRVSRTWHLGYYWTASLVIMAIARGTEGGALLLVLFLYPLTVCTALHGLKHGLSLGFAAAAAWCFKLDGTGFDMAWAYPAAALLLVPLITAVLSSSMAVLRQRLLLTAELDQELDPRRGLVAVGLVAGERLRQATAARRVLLCHRDAEVATVLVCDADDGAFMASAALGSRVLALLDQLLAQPQALPPARPRADPRHTSGPLNELAQLLEADGLQLVPDAPGKAHSNWLLVAHGAEPDHLRKPWPLPVLAGFATDLRRLLQQASYVDRLQEEIAAHERSRIGRDLHDSAIQPYLGLKFAIEGLALRCDAGNALHGQIQELRNVCEAELVELRKTVSALRAGDSSGEYSLGAALQRQCTRFARLFEIQVHLQVPPELPINRTLVSAVLHMVNEALNNVRRHTQAQQVWVALTEVPGALRLVVRDDAGQRSGKAAPAFEPRSLTERAQELGGALELRQHNGVDTEIHITVPT